MTDAQRKAQQVERTLFEKVLSINPALANSRTYEQVHGLRSSARAPATPTVDADVHAALQQGVEAFLHAQRQTLAAAEEKLQADLVAAQRAHAAVLEHLRGQTRSFFSVLDPQALARFGHAVLAGHAEFLDAIDLAPIDLLPMRRTR